MSKRIPNHIYFNHFSYASAHGRAPRGRGHWAFIFGRDGEVEFAPSGSGEFAGGLLYSEAKKWAQSRAKELGVSFVVVGS